MENRILPITPAPANYTITITNQKGVCLIYPGNSTEWRVRRGTTIQFANTTQHRVTVTVQPDAYEQPNIFTIEAYSVIVKTVAELPEGGPQIAIIHTFNCDSDNQTKTNTGGPRMVVTDK